MQFKETKWRRNEIRWSASQGQKCFDGKVRKRDSHGAQLRMAPIETAGLITKQVNTPECITIQRLIRVLYAGFIHHCDSVCVCVCRLTVLVCLQQGGGAAGPVSRRGEAEGGAVVPGELPEAAH